MLKNMLINIPKNRRDARLVRPPMSPKSAGLKCRDMPLACIMRPPGFAHYTCRLPTMSPKSAGHTIVGTCLWHVLYGRHDLRRIHAGARIARFGMSLRFIIDYHTIVGTCHPARMIWPPRFAPYTCRRSLTVALTCPYMSSVYKVNAAMRLRSLRERKSRAPQALRRVAGIRALYMPLTEDVTEKRGTKM